MVWIFGDEFAHGSFENYFKRNNNISYTKETFDVSGFFTSRFTSNDQNAISRLRNALATAITAKVHLPKFIVIVPDDNLLRYAKIAKSETSSVSMGKLINSVMLQHNRYIEIQKEYLPSKSQCDQFPIIIWIEAPINNSFPNNEKRIKFNKSLNHIAKFHENVHVLQLKKIWDPQDSNYYVFENRRFTVFGLGKYWEAVNATIKFADTILIKKVQRKAARAKAAEEFDGSNKYKWVNKAQGHKGNNRKQQGKIKQPRSTEDHKKYRKYPTPPPARKRLDYD